jgi:hypothetical protein
MTCYIRWKRGVLTLVLFLLAAVSFAAPPQKTPDFVPGSWTLALLPDTQIYALQYPGLFTLQTHWVAQNKDKYNIRYAVSLGDITDKNTKREWRHAQAAFAELDGRVPYVLTAGNHDYAPHGDVVSGTTGLNKYFSPSQFKSWPTFGGVMKPGEMANSYHLFSAGGADWIILALEWTPRNATVQWANEVLAKYPERKAILVTHAYLYRDCTRYHFTEKGKAQEYSPHTASPLDQTNDGEELWQKLVRKHNFALVLCGHVCNHGRGLLASKSDRGRMTQQMVVDYQNRPLGGEGYLRLLEFLPDGKTVHAKTYSPLYDKYLDDDANQFSFELDRCPAESAAAFHLPSPRSKSIPVDPAT